MCVLLDQPQKIKRKMFVERTSAPPEGGTDVTSFDGGARTMLPRTMKVMKAREKKRAGITQNNGSESCLFRQYQ